MDATPLAQDLWEGIGGHFDSFSQVICEFIDNSIANFEGKNAPNKTINLSIEDNDQIKRKILSLTLKRQAFSRIFPNFSQL